MASPVEPPSPVGAARATTTPAAPAMPEVSVVTVSYNSAGVLPGMIASLPAGVELIVVDNASADVEQTAALAAQAGGRLVRLERNLGFGAGCNRGAAAARGRYILFLNPDAELAPGALAALVAAAEAHPGAGGFNPRIRRANGRPFFLHRSALLPRREWTRPGWPGADGPVPVLSGAALFVRRADFAAVGGFDEAIFLYHEDDDLSLRLARQVGPLRFVGAAEVMHRLGSSTPPSPAVQRLKARHMALSRVYAQRKHGRRGAAAVSVARALALLALPSTWLRPDKRRKRLAAAGGALAGWRMEVPEA